jgi:hypothetical protein
MELISETVQWLREYVNDCDEGSETARQAAELADALEEQIKTLSSDAQKFYVMPDGRDDCDCPTSPDPMPLSAIGAHVALLRSMYRRQGYFSNARQEHIPLDELQFRLVPAEDEPEDEEIVASRWVGEEEGAQ